MTLTSVVDAVQSSTPDIVIKGKPKGWKPKGFHQDDSLIAGTKKDLNGRYCSYFFNRAEINNMGLVFMCCPFWLPVVIGDLNVNTMEEIWNGSKAQEIRNQLYDGANWPHCKHNTCPKIQYAETALPLITNVIDNPKKYNVDPIIIESLKNRSTQASYLPHDIQVGTDESCNLYCPSCRNSKIIHSKGEKYDQRKSLTDKLFDEIMKAPKDYQFDIWITGGGDPFGGGNPFGDIFKDIFGGRHRQREQNFDAQTDIVLPLEEVYNGSTQRINVGTGMIDIKIPKGVQEGTRFTLHGKGPQQDPNLPPGNLFVRVRYQPHREFAKNGNDLIGIIQIDYFDALVGANIDVRHISGRMLSVTIPALTEPNSRLKLRGEGFTDPRNSIVGDFLLQVEVIPPDSLSHEHANLIQRIKQERRRNN